VADRLQDLRWTRTHGQPRLRVGICTLTPKRRRQWDFASPHRRNLRPAGLVEPALPAALKDALAVYYYPGIWDWQHEVTQPLVHKALERSLNDAAATDMLARAAALLDCYDAWADVVDDFAPVKSTSTSTAW